jgi:hypothetical protein
MNCELTVYREAFKLFQGRPQQVWSVVWLLERYVNGAIAQLDRARETVQQMSDYHGTWLLDQLLLDIHFYFICWDKAQKLVEQLTKVKPDPNLEQVWVKFKPLCKPFTRARNNLEHIDRELAHNPSETGSLGGDVFIFAGKRFDISGNGLKVLTDMYEEVINALTIVDASGKPFSLDAYQRLPWKPSIRREPPGHR